MRRTGPAAAGLLPLAVAGSVTIGSDLEAKADKTRSAPVDSAYWNTRIAGGRRVRAPRKGEISIVKGGFGPAYADGAPFRMFSSRSGSAFKGFTGAGGDMQGDTFRGRKRKGELLMQVKIATGTSARPTCR